MPATGAATAAGSYFGMRTIGVALVERQHAEGTQRKAQVRAGHARAGLLAGRHTTPHRRTTRSSSTSSKNKRMGFNTIRKHVKVEPDRWYYWADRLGLLVWQDMPAMTDGAAPDRGRPRRYENELRRMIDQHLDQPGDRHVGDRSTKAGASTTRPASPTRSRPGTRLAWSTTCGTGRRAAVARGCDAHRGRRGAQELARRTFARRERERGGDGGTVDDDPATRPALTLAEPRSGPAPKRTPDTLDATREVVAELLRRGFAPVAVARDGGKLAGSRAFASRES